MKAPFHGKTTQQGSSQEKQGWIEHMRVMKYAQDTTEQNAL